MVVSTLPEKILVLGIGNILLKDDGVGPLIIRQLEKNCEIPNVTFLDGGTQGLDLLAYLDGYSCVLVIDALDIGQKPGSIFCWEGKTLDGLPTDISFHQMGLNELISAARLLEMDMDFIILGVQAQDLSFGMELSEPVKKAVPLLKEAVIKKIGEYLQSGGDF